MNKLFAFSAVFFLFYTQLLYAGCPKKSIKSGSWIGELKLNEENTLMFDLSIRKKGKTWVYEIINAEEVIEMKSPEKINDTIYLGFPVFDSELVFAITNSEEINGYWINHTKKNYKIPFRATYSDHERFSHTTNATTTTNFSGKYQVYFGPNTEDFYPAIGLFEQDLNRLTGTFLTETGDYRFLEGNTIGDSMYLSCFDGSHAFLFTGKMTNNKIKGKFFSGKHWQTTWEGTVNETFELAHPDSITFLKDKNQVITFNATRLDGNGFTFNSDDFLGKVTIVQIMGTWCPNCFDETTYLIETLQKHKSTDLEVLAVCYEIGDDFEEHKKRVERFTEKMSLPYDVVIGGNASKDEASKDFWMLNKISSFPTTLFFDKQGNLVRIHTGFNGPGTGSYYETFKKETNMLIEALLEN